MTLPANQPARLSRRSMLVGSGVLGGALVAAGLVRRCFRQRAGVFIARYQRYDGDLVRTIRDGLAATGIDAAQIKDKRVLLKPNLVEPTRDAPHMTTHP